MTLRDRAKRIQEKKRSDGVLVVSLVSLGTSLYVLSKLQKPRKNSLILLTVVPP